jgi:hypothetical protein
MRGFEWFLELLGDGLRERGFWAGAEVRKTTGVALFLELSLGGSSISPKKFIYILSKSYDFYGSSKG